jgi:hypothetical protein
MCVMLMPFILPLRFVFPLEAVFGRKILFQMDIEPNDVMWGAPFFDDDTSAFATQRFVDNVAAQFARAITQVIEIPVPDVDRTVHGNVNLEAKERACSRKQSVDRCSIAGLMLIDLPVW